MVGFILAYTQSRGMHNAWIANAAGILECSFDFYILRCIIENAKADRIILIVTAIFVLFAFVNILVIQKKAGFNSINFTIGCLILVVLCIYYFFELFQKTDAESLSRLPAFWIASAILFNTVLTFPTFALLSFMQETNRFNKGTTKIVLIHISVIFNIISVLTYILYSIAFLCRIRIRRSTS
jgi:hypothetical protein